MLLAMELISTALVAPLYSEAGSWRRIHLEKSGLDRNMKSVCTNPVRGRPAMGVSRCTAVPDLRTQFLGSSPRAAIMSDNFLKNSSLSTLLLSTPRSKSPDVGLSPVDPSMLSCRGRPVMPSNHCTVVFISERFMRWVRGLPCSSLKTLPPSVSVM